MESRIRQMYATHYKSMDARRAAEMWYPTAIDLELPDVPWDYREDVRGVLSFLGKVPIQKRDGSWLISQAIAELGNPRVEYVEGLMSTVAGNKVNPGAWNLVDGHIVSLFTEVLNRAKSEVWLYEPLKLYPLSEIYVARKAGHPTCSGHEWLQTVVGKPDYNVMEKVFNDPLQRMLDRKQTDHKVVTLDWN